MTSNRVEAPDEDGAAGGLAIDPYSISDVVVEGDSVSWSYVWVNNAGESFCAAGNELDVNTEGLIVELRWGPDPGECDE